MNSTQREVLAFALTVTLFVAGAVAVSQRFTNAGAVLVMGSGVASILLRDSIAAAQNRIKAATWSPWAPVRPRVFVWWGVGLVVLGMAWLIAG